MTNLQLLLPVGVPSVLICLSTVLDKRRFDTLEKRFDGLDRRFDSIDSGFKISKAGIDVRADSVGTCLKELRAKYHEDMVALRAAFAQLYVVLAKLESRVNELSKRQRPRSTE